MSDSSMQHYRDQVVAVAVRQNRRVSFATAPGRTVTICERCITQREPHVSRAIAAGDITIIALRPEACRHCGRR